MTTRTLEAVPEPTVDPPLVLMLTDDFHLDDVAVLSTRKPTLYSVHFRSANGSIRNFIATESQMIRMRDEIDRAVDQARSLPR